MKLFKKVLGKTSSKLDSIFKKSTIQAVDLDQLEEQLIMADFGPKLSATLIDLLRPKKLAKDKSINDCLYEIVEPLMASHQKSIKLNDKELNIIVMVGVNGSGKTTTIAKLANYYQKQGLKVMIAAADTFRAAAVEQLSLWAEKLKIEIVTGKTNSDPSSVAYKSVDQAQKNNTDVLIIDTSGRLHNKSNLMDELKKLSKVVRTKAPKSEIHNILTLDATIGQNAINQINTFDEYIQLSGLIITKLDGSAKGGMVFSLQTRDEKLPIYFIGTGETPSDLLEFDSKSFCKSLLNID